MSTFSWYDMYWQPRSRNIYMSCSTLHSVSLLAKETDQHFTYFDLFTITALACVSIVFRVRTHVVFDLARLGGKAKFALHRQTLPEAAIAQPLV